MTRRLHLWLAWIAAVPLLLWTISGLFMVSFPIDQVRGTAVRAAPLTLRPSSAFAMPTLSGQAVTHMALLPRIDRPVWVVHRADETMAAFSAEDGAPLPLVDGALAQRIADAALITRHRVVSVRRFAADSNPIDLRRKRPAWQVEYIGGTRVYVDAETGEVLAVRSRLWRAFDFMWGLHIMDPVGREDTHHPLLWGAAFAALLASGAGVILLFQRKGKKPR